MRTVVARAETPAHDNSKLWHVRTSHRANHLRAVLRDATALRFRADHVASHIDEEEERDLALRA